MSILAGDDMQIREQTRDANAILFTRHSKKSTQSSEKGIYEVKQSDTPTSDP